MRDLCFDLGNVLNIEDLKLQTDSVIRVDLLQNHLGYYSNSQPNLLDWHIGYLGLRVISNFHYYKSLSTLFNTEVVRAKP